MILDVGCGKAQRNKPLLIPSTINIDIKKTDFNKDVLDVLCDGHQLPFRDEVFNVVYSSHVLEHVFNPIQFLDEMKRVSKKKVIIKVPVLTKRCNYYEAKEHIFSWSEISFRNLLSLVFSDVKISYSKRTPKPIRLCSFEKTFNSLVNWVFYVLISHGEKNEFTAICMK